MVDVLPEPSQPTQPQGKSSVEVSPVLEQPTGLGQSTLPPMETGENEWIANDVARDIAPDRGEQFYASFKEGWEAAPTSSIIRFATRKQLQLNGLSNGVKPLTPEEANKLIVPGMEPYSTDTDPNVVQLDVDTFKARERNRRWIARGESHLFDDLGAQGIATLIDPVNIGLTLATAGVARVFGLASKMASAEAISAAAAKATTAATEATLAGRAAGLSEEAITKIAASVAKKAGAVEAPLSLVFADNFVGNAIGEAIAYSEQKYEHANPEASDFLINATTGAIFGTGLHIGISAIGKKLRTLKLLPDDVHEDILRKVLISLEEGKKPDISENFAKAFAALNNPKNVDGFEYKYSPSKHPSEKVWFAGKTGSGRDVSFSPLAEGGIHLTENESLIHRVTSGRDEALGKIRQYEVPKDAKILDLEIRADSPEAAPVIASIEKALGEKIELSEGMTLKDFLTKVDSTDISTPKGKQVLFDVNEKLAIANESLKEQGYQGFKYHEKTPTGEFRHEGMVLFDESTKPTREFKQDRNLIPKKDAIAKGAEEGTAHETVQKSKFYDEVAEKELAEAKSTPSVNSDPKYMDDVIVENYDSEMARMEESAKTSPLAAKDLKNFKKGLMKADNTAVAALKKFGDCAKGSLS